KLAPANYRIVHYDSPDRRGIDVGFLYRPDIFKLEGSAEIPFKMPGQPNFLTRGFVTMWGTIDDEPFFFLVSHWPSRLGGKEASSPKREAAGRAIRMIKDSVLKNNPSTKVVIMGDLNDDATDKSIVDPDCLGAKAKVKDLQAGDFYNPFIDVLKAGMGTLAYQDSWNLFDNIIVSENLVNDKEGLRLKKSDGSKYNGYIFRRPYMVQQSGQYRGYPLRTFVGTNFQDGFSDHFPVYIYIGKQTTK
ncbi:MAG: endonuclease/exonuclease/phosphatase family protein, partial [Alistipes sp.]|nr:endonuclease/exonuclease/phosphatase family protein [Alistipes sp.]